MARTKTNTRNDTKTLKTSCRNRHLDKPYFYVFNPLLTFYFKTFISTKAVIGALRRLYSKQIRILRYSTSISTRIEIEQNKKNTLGAIPDVYIRIGIQKQLPDNMAFSI